MNRSSLSTKRSTLSIKDREEEEKEMDHAGTESVSRACSSVSRAEPPVAIPAGDLQAGGVHSGGDRLHPLRLLHLLAGPLPDQPRPRQVLLGQLQLPPRHLPHPRGVSSVLLQGGCSSSRLLARRRTRAGAGADRQVEVEHGTTTTLSLIVLFHGNKLK